MKKYHSYDLEILAIVRAVQKFRVYLLGLIFKIVTDCKAIQRTLMRNVISPKVARWALYLEEFSNTIEHRAGSRLKHVDALSRFPTMVVEDILLLMIKKK